MQEKILIELDQHSYEMEGFQFVLRAMFSKPGSDERCHAHCIKIKDGEIVGTDGRRCHVYTTQETYKNGYYRVLKRLKTDVILLKVDESDYKSKFPEYKTLFELEHDAPVPISADLYNFQYVVSYTKIIRALPLTQALHPNDIVDLDSRFDVYIFRDRVVFKGENKKACIDPIRTDMEA